MLYRSLVIRDGCKDFLQFSGCFLFLSETKVSKGDQISAVGIVSVLDSRRCQISVFRQRTKADGSICGQQQYCQAFHWQTPDRGSYQTAGHYSRARCRAHLIRLTLSRNVLPRSLCLQRYCVLTFPSPPSHG